MSLTCCPDLQGVLLDIDPADKIKYVPPEETLAALEEVSINILSPDSIAEAQKNCPEVQAHRDGKGPKGVVVDDVVMGNVSLLCEVSDVRNPRPVVPVGQRSLILNLFHHVDHPSVRETGRRTCSQYYWPKMKKDITSFVTTCHPCQLAKQARSVDPGVGDFPVPDKRFSFIHLDIVGPMPESSGFKYLLTILDRTSRWLEALPLRADSSEEVCRAFMEYVSRFGIPLRACSDNGNAFISNLFQGIMKTFNVQVTFSPAYHAATNGAVERQHQTIKNSLKAALVDMGNVHKDKWFQALPWVLLGKRIQYQPHLDASAAQLVLGKSPIIPGQLLGDPGPPLNSTQVRSLLDQLYKLADRPPVQMSGRRIQKDISHTERVTHVYIKVDNPKNLHPKWEGPYPVVTRPSRSTLTVELGKFADGSSRLQTYHWSSAKAAHMREGALVGQRPKLGRKPQDNAPQTTPQTSEPDYWPVSTETQPVEQDLPLVGPPPEPGNFQTRQSRSTRNPNPKYK